MRRGKFDQTVAHVKISCRTLVGCILMVPRIGPSMSKACLKRKPDARCQRQPRQRRHLDLRLRPQQPAEDRQRRRHSSTLAYDTEGRLRQSVIAAVTTQLTYDSQDLVAEYNAAGALQRRYVHGPGVDEPLVVYEGTTTTDKSWLYADHLGSIVGTANATGASTAKGQTELIESTGISSSPSFPCPRA